MVQVIVSKESGDDEPEDVLVSMLAKLPDDPDFQDVAHTFDGAWVDEEGDPL